MQVHHRQVAYAVATNDGKKRERILKKIKKIKVYFKEKEKKRKEKKKERHRASWNWFYYIIYSMHCCNIWNVTTHILFVTTLLSLVF